MCMNIQVYLINTKCGEKKKLRSPGFYLDFILSGFYLSQKQNFKRQQLNVANY